MGTSILINGKSCIIGRRKRFSINRDAYGVEWDVTNSSPLLTRIGNIEYHKTLPIQSQLRGCICQGSKIMYYLHPDDWNLKEDGTLSRLDGYDGTVRVEVPRFYLWSEIDGNIRRVYISLKKCVPYAMESPHMVMDAYRPTILRTKVSDMGYLSTLPQYAPISVYNTNTYCRGGVNNASYDKYLDTEPLRSHLGKPMTGMNRMTFRKYAKDAGTIPLNYHYYKSVFYWLWVIEYASFHSQANYKEELTPEGFRQGGMSIGISNISFLDQFNNTNPVIPCNYMNHLGNHTGIRVIPSYVFQYNTVALKTISGYSRNTGNMTSTLVSNNSFNITNFKTVSWVIQSGWNSTTGTVTYKIEGLQEGQSMTFKRGSTVKLVVQQDGEYTITWEDNKQTAYLYNDFTGDCNITLSIVSATAEISNITQNTLTSFRWRGFDNTFGDIWTHLDGTLSKYDGNGYRELWATSNPDLYGDDSSALEKMQYIGKEPSMRGWISMFDLGNQAEIVPLEKRGGDIRYKCDSSWSNADGSLHCLLLGGGANLGSVVGLASFFSDNGVALAYSHIGFRTYNIIK